MMKKNKKNTFIFNLFILTVIFNFWFPKAGIKISNIPLTIGNILFAILFLIWLINKLKGNFSINKIHIAILCMISYFMIKYLIIGNFVSNIGYIIPLIVYPFMFFLSSDIIDSDEKKFKFIKCITIGFYIITIYAIIQYIFGINKVAIPGLTVNLTDYKKLGQYWYMTKANGTDITLAKIVSTYQNGNLFGVNLLLFYPIIFNYYKNDGKIGKVVISLLLFLVSGFLTLSRTVWLGIILFILFNIILVKVDKKSYLIIKIISIIILLITIPCIFKYFPSISARFTNTDSRDLINMSGRTDGFIRVITTVNETNNIFAWLFGPAGIIKYSGLAYEMTALAIFTQVGIVGMISFYGIIIFVSVKAKDDWLRKSIKMSVILWCIYGLIEGGFWLPPTALNLFMLLGILNNKEI